MMQTQVNPAQLIQMIKSGKNPQQLMMNVLETQAQNNPIYANLTQMAKQGRTRDIERFARNLAASQGLDFDKEFAAFRQRTGL
jgi:hypothetical protein